MKKILIVIENPELRSFVAANYKRTDIDPVETENCQTALEQLNEAGTFCAAVLDDQNDAESLQALCNALHALESPVPVLMLANENAEAVAAYLLADTDVMLKKPCSPAQLYCGLDTLLEKKLPAVTATEGVLRFGPFELDCRAHSLMKHDKSIKLTQLESILFQMFLQNPGRVFSHEDIMLNIWGKENPVDIRTVDINIRRLRVKIEEDAAKPAYIVSVAGYGYKLSI